MSRPRSQKALCPRPAKKYYATYLTACVALAKQLRNSHDGRLPPVRAYLCYCGLWHLTSQPLTTTPNKETLT